MPRARRVRTSSCRPSPVHSTVLRRLHDLREERPPSRYHSRLGAARECRSRRPEQYLAYAIRFARPFALASCPAQAFRFCHWHVAPAATSLAQAAVSLPECTVGWQLCATATCAGHRCEDLASFSVRHEDGTLSVAIKQFQVLSNGEAFPFVRSLNRLRSRAEDEDARIGGAVV